MKRVLWLVVLTAAFGLGAVLAYHNTIGVPLDYLAGRSERPLVLWLLLSFVLGCALTFLWAAIRSLRLRTEMRGLRQRLSRAEAELKTLRGLPLKDA